jgi:3-oxoadipate enol-lactonase
VAAALEAMMTRPDSTADLATIACPTLVIAGAEDVVTPVGDAEAMQRQIARSRLVVIPAAGHLSNLEAPETFSTALEDFLSSNI